jgi:ABC-type iron transport system FetAB permease component
LIYADVFFIYVYNFSKTARSLEEEGQASNDITQQKFIALSLFIIGYFLSAIFAENGIFSFLCLLYYATSIAEHTILKSSKMS